MRGLRNRLFRYFLERNPEEITKRAEKFVIRTEEGHRLVARLGEAFLGGYHALLRLETLEEVAGRGRAVDPHFRPFFFEGAAMGYLARAAFDSRFRPATAQQGLLSLDSRFRYLYYVGLGFWMGIRHPRNPNALQSLSHHLDSLYAPLCYDGLGFKLGFFDYPTHPDIHFRLQKVHGANRSQAYQGFGRALFFVHMDDSEGWESLRNRLPAECKRDLEFGRALALAFTGINNPVKIVAHLQSALNEDDRQARLLGVTWALTAREMNDPDYFRACLQGFTSPGPDFLGQLPSLCRQARAESRTYSEWQEKTAVKLLGAGPKLPI